MLTLLSRLSALAVCTVIMFASTDARADYTIEGKVLFVGTISEFHQGESEYQARLRVKLRGKCSPLSGSPSGVAADSWDFWVHIRSGQIVPPWSHNGPNFINAYNTLLTALTTKKTVRIDGLKTNCGVLPPGGLLDNEDLWNLSVGIAR
jgi:hypothetical protein